ncbi:MAG: prepilin-type N-terminal cleavage/methylation domain-containing protein [Oscillospiraceae bacterium]|jgi:prepilin-type N-terminal cleavage/methylation domain-containing protein|nr:prepilin-type N-terminal cleavage/methylation domain-containing protein [Oscillospiraceae bacterium]MCR5305826.1 prepilin-type N-terminal cleavage/methylation domain-containing protein [Oscillospiraceae bacterium]
MQQKQMKRKGMTLLEVIISIAVYAVLALLLAEIMTLVNSTMRSTEQMNNRLSYEAKYADNLMTVDADGTPFAKLTEMDAGAAVPAVKVSIRYDVQPSEKTVVNHQVTAIKADASKTLSKDKGGKLLRASEYTTNYKEESPGTHYHDNTNYRFITFEKVSNGKSVKPTGAFPVFIWFLEHTYDDIDALLVNGNLAGSSADFPLRSTNGIYGVNSKPFQFADGTTPQSIIVNVLNDAPDTAAGDPVGDKDGDLFLYVYKKQSYGEKAGRMLNLAYSLTAADINAPTFNPDVLSDTNQYSAKLGVKYLLSVVGGSASNPVVNYYNRYDVVFDGSALRVPTAQEKNDLGIPTNYINY